MTRVDFYVLPEDREEDALAVACKLCEKAVAAGQRVHVHAPDAAVADEIDRLLWVYKQGGFISHERASGPLEPPLPSVLIGGDEPPESHREVLLNLGAEAPAFFATCRRVLEVVAGDAAARSRSRARFKFYRDAGCAPETHKL
jgi:DNA polymerase-3 subunit chi